MAGAVEERLPLTEPLAPVSTPEDDFLRLRRLLCRARGFALALVGSNVPAERDRFIERLEASLAGEGIELRRLALSEPTDDLYGALAALAPAAGQAVAVAGFERSIPSRVEYPPALARLNRMRELFRDLPCPVVLFLPQYALTRLAREAPDFWAWRSAVFDVGTPSAPAALVQRDPTELDLVGYANLSAERKQGHLEVLRGLLREEEELSNGHEALQADLLIRISFVLRILGEYTPAQEAAEKAADLGGKAGEPALVARALGRLAEICFRRGELDEALRIRKEEELPIYEKLSDVRSRAITLGQIADIYEASGELDEALRIHQEEELPIYEKLGDVRERAIAFRKIADIYYVRGALGEALRIHREEELPVFENLGDLREHAITLGRIADIYSARGNLDEALRIRQEEELPVYEKLGDLRERTMTLGGIADIYSARGDLDEALRIHKEEVLPIQESLGEKEANANSLWRIGKIELQRQNMEHALSYLAEAYSIVVASGYLNGIATVGLDLGQLLCAGGDVEKGRTILLRSRAAFEKLGREDDVRRVDEILAQLPDGESEPSAGIGG